MKALSRVLYCRKYESAFVTIEFQPGNTPLKANLPLEEAMQPIVSGIRARLNLHVKSATGAKVEDRLRKAMKVDASSLVHLRA
jgi:hypothetical protein